MDFAFYDSGNSSEQAATIPITIGSPYSFVQMFKITVPNVQAGDLIDVTAYGQVSNNNGTNATNYNVMFGYNIKAGAPGNETQEVAESRTTNIDRVRHHESWQIATSWKANANYPLLSIVVIGYSASSIAQPGWVLTVDRDYGRLQAKHWYQPAVAAAE